MDELITENIIYYKLEVKDFPWKGTSKKCHKGTDEGKVYKGCDQPWISSLDRAIRIDLNEPGLKVIIGEHPA